MLRMDKKKDYLAEFPMPKSSIENNVVLKNEMQRILKKNKSKKEVCKIALEPAP